MLIVSLAIFCCYGVSAFTSGNYRMHTRITYHCNPDLLDEHGKPEQCHISKSMETMGLVLPGMDDGKTFTYHQDVFVVKDGQVALQASPNHPYQYIVKIDTHTTSSVHQLFNKKSYTISQASHGGTPGLRRLDYGHSLKDDGWTYEGVVDIDNQKVNKWVKRGVEGVDKKSNFNYTALAQTGIIPNSWTLYTDQSGKRLVKLLSLNTHHDNRVFQETTVTHWEDLHTNVTTNHALGKIRSIYGIEGHSEEPPSDEVAPKIDPRLVGTHLVGESGRLFFNDGETPDWRPNRRLRVNDKSATGVDYFDIKEGTAAHKFFLAQYDPNEGRILGELVKFEYPKGCKVGQDTTGHPYCIYVDVDASRTSLALGTVMSFTDVHESSTKAHLNIGITVQWPTANVVLDFQFEGSGCAVIFQKGSNSLDLNIEVCIDGTSNGHNMLQPDDKTYEGHATFTASFNLKVPVSSEMSVKVEGGIRVLGAPHGKISSYGYISLGLSVQGAGASVTLDVFGNTVENKPNVWDFNSQVVPSIWINILFYKHSWSWTFTIWKAGPVTF